MTEHSLSGDEQTPRPAPTFCPVYEKDGNEFVVLLKDWTGEDEETAHKVALGSMLVECVLFNMKFTGRIVAVDPHNFPHRKADINGFPLAIIAGPAFEEAAHV